MSEEERVELKIDTPNNSEISEKTFNRKTFWKSCCGCNIDKRAVKFFSQLSISITLIIFCLYQLHTKPKCDTGEYLSLLTMIVGVYVEAPRLN